MNIIILEDNHNMQMFCKNLIDEFNKTYFSDFTVKLITDDPFLIKNFILQKSCSAIFLLDILIDNETEGIALAKLIYDKNPQNKIIFMTMICIFIVICIVTLYFAICYIKKLETMCHDYELKNQFYQIEKNRFDEIIKLKHYFIRLLKYCNKYLITNDIESFKSALEKNILPIEKSLSEQKTKDMIRFISNPLLKDLFQQFISDAEQHHIDFKLELDQPILNIGMNELDLFKILSIYIENALEETANQKNGFIHILITKMQDKLIFKISNSLHSNNVNIKKQSFGKGLHIAKEIVGKYSNVNIATNIVDEVYIQMIEIGGVYHENNC